MNKQSQINMEYTWNCFV